MSSSKLSWLRTFAQIVPGLGLAGWLAGTGSVTLAQDVAVASKSYLNKTTITLPVLLEDKYRAQLQSIQLFVKERPTEPWKLAEKAPPTQTSFTYRAPNEGEYWFNIVSVDTAGRSVPADINKEGPALVVVIDSQAPQVNVQPLQNAPEGQYVRCEIRDAHLDASKTRFYYQTGDQVWRDLAAQSGKPDTFCVPSQAVWTGMVRAVATDLAGNSSTRELNLAGAPVTNAAATSPATPTTNNPPSLPMTGTAAPTLPTSPPPAPLPDNLIPVNGETLVVVDPITLQPQGGTVNKVAPTPPSSPLPVAATPTPPTPAQAETPVLPPAGTTVVQKPGKLLPQNVIAPAPNLGQQLYDPSATRPAGLPHQMPEVRTASLLTKDASPANRHLVSAPRMYIDYKVEAVGASGVGRVEVWYTRDLGQSWHKLSEDSDRKSPLEVNLPGEGLFGVSLVVSNGRGFGANPPRTGDTPDYWVEVDTTRPVADITAIHAGEDGALHISWSARDKNLATEPIEVSYSTKREGPWHTVAKGLRNDGGYRWVPPGEVGPQAYFRVSVRDQAGNVTHAETTQAVPLDDQSRPRGRVLGITTASPRNIVPLPE